MTNTTSNAGVGTRARLDHATLRAEVRATDTRYTIGVRGGADERWAEALRALCEQSAAHRPFHFSREGGTISFSCRTLEGPALVFEMLERLEVLLDLVDRRVAAGPLTGSAAAAPPVPRTFA